MSQMLNSRAPEAAVPERISMPLMVGQACPAFTLDALAGAPGLPQPAAGTLFSDWAGGAWTLVVTLKAMSPTCSTELAALSRASADFERSGIRLLGVAVESADELALWRDQVSEDFACTPRLPILADTALSVGQTLGLIDPYAATPALLRTAFAVAPDGRIASLATYSVTNGRNFAEWLRHIQAMQLTAAQRVATPGDWEQGGPVMLPPSLSAAATAERYPAGVRVKRAYLRFVDLPAVPAAGQ